MLLQREGSHERGFSKYCKIVNCIQFCTNINILTLGIIYAEFRSPGTTLKSEARPLNTFNPLCHE